MQVTQHLWFETGMDQALDLYTSLIPGSGIDWRQDIEADPDLEQASGIRMAGFHLGGQSYQAMEAQPFDRYSHRFSIMVECDTQDQIDRLWDALSEGGQPEQCGWLADRWGVLWQIAPRQLGELMRDPDPALRKRVTMAFMQMVKFDLAALQAAARG